MIEQRGADVRIMLRVQPRASKTALAGEHAGALKVRLAAPPVDGAANEELVRWIARQLKVAPSRVSIVSGESSRSKIVHVEGVAADDVRRILLP